ncbi:BNR repeat-containing protein [Phytohabitans suffuscus]|uniref:Neuraminidase n=1 Tax=Phytohabitans suffuscus TaxID=624315 RepID=A0A6F8YJB2_9ACTN|nr:BNR repeat-containing protein [Phytohabitans suffuscus]BCB86058.1 hypothetical protein Psuf_033710 [Phytohabitans suffuscus]
MIDLDLFPGNASGARAFNGEPFVQDNVLRVVESGQQVRYAVWVDGARQPVVGRRVLPHGRWQTVRLADVPGMTAEFGLPNAVDSHNTWSMAMDADGYLHISGNHHNHPLRYARSTNPRSITAWTAAPMVGTNEGSVTYPQFVRVGTGLLFFYRDGLSGTGNVLVNRYDTVSKTWSRLHSPLIDAVASAESPYLHYIGLGPDDSIHIAVIWRDSGAETNNDVCHARSTDGGVTWRQMNGTALSLPLTHGGWPPALDTPPTNFGLLNSCGMAVDANGHPHIGNEQWSSGQRTQYSHLYWNGTSWTNEVLTDWQYAMPFSVGANAVNAELSRPALVCAGGRTYMLYRHNRERPGALMLRDITPGGDQAEASILNLPLWGCEFSINARTTIDHGRLEVLVCPARQEDVTPPALPVNKWAAIDTCWANQVAGVISISLDDLDDVVHGRVRAPGLELIASTAMEGSAYFTPTLSTSPVGLASFQVLIPGEYAGRRLVARHAGRWNLDQGSATSYTVELNQTGTARASLTTATALTTPVLMWHPVALLDTSNMDDGTYVSLTAKVAGGSGSPRLRMTTGTLQVFAIVGSDGRPL